MKCDSILKEVHAVKEKIAGEANYDMKKLAKRFRESQKKYSDRLVDALPPRTDEEEEELFRQ